MKPATINTGMPQIVGAGNQSSNSYLVSRRYVFGGRGVSPAVSERGPKALARKRRKKEKGFFYHLVCDKQIEGETHGSEY